MTTFKQFEANRRNALKSTGPITDAGKQRSRRNAVRHGLTAETVITTLEDEEDYKAFELSVTSGFDSQTAVERELVLRLASLLWRLRRATAIDTGLIQMQSEILDEIRHLNEPQRPARRSRLAKEHPFAAPIGGRAISSTQRQTTTQAIAASPISRATVQVTSTRP